MELDYGCYVDRCRGFIDSQVMVCDLASHLGWTGEVPKDPEDFSDWDDLGDAAEEAENWLNNNIAARGAAFGWHEGNFMYWTTEEWQQI